MVWLASTSGLLLSVRDLCQGRERVPQFEVDGQHQYVEFWQCQCELFCDTVADAYIDGYDGGDGELGVGLGDGLHAGWRQLSGDAEPESDADADSTVRADDKWIGYWKPYDQQQLDQRKYDNGVVERYGGGALAPGQSYLGPTIHFARSGRGLQHLPINRRRSESNGEHVDRYAEQLCRQCCSQWHL